MDATPTTSENDPTPAEDLLAQVQHLALLRANTFNGRHATMLHVNASGGRIVCTVDNLSGEGGTLQAALWRLRHALLETLRRQAREVAAQVEATLGMKFVDARGGR